MRKREHRRDGNLASDPNHRGIGIRRRLRRAVVDMLWRDGLHHPADRASRPVKTGPKTLHAGLERALSYEVFREGRFKKDQKPHLAPRLATPPDR